MRLGPQALAPFLPRLIGLRAGRALEVGSEFGPTLEVAGGDVRGHLAVRVRDGCSIEPLHYVRPEVQGRPAAPRNHWLHAPLRVRVDDIDAVAAKLVEYGGTVLDATRYPLALGEGRSNDFVFVADPDGVRVELMKLSRRRRIASPADGYALSTRCHPWSLTPIAEELHPPLQSGGHDAVRCDCGDWTASCPFRIYCVPVKRDRGRSAVRHCTKLGNAIVHFATIAKKMPLQGLGNAPWTRPAGMPDLPFGHPPIWVRDRFILQRSRKVPLQGLPRSRTSARGNVLELPLCARRTDARAETRAGAE